MDVESEPRDVVAARIPSKETGDESEHLLGDFGGMRNRWVERGIHLYAGYAGEVLGNVSGGIRRGVVYEGLLELGLEVDTGKMNWWPGGLFKASSLHPHGRGLTTRYVGDLLAVSNIDGHDSIRLYELWFEQKFLREQFSLKLGQLVADEEFTVTEGSGEFLNSAFGWPAFISGNTINTGPAFYAAAPGARLRYEAGSSLYLQAGIFDGDTFDSPTGDPTVNASGLRVHVSGGQGYFWIGEAGYRITSDERGDGALPGEYKVGVWGHTGEFASNSIDRSGNPIALSGLDAATRSSNYGVYVAGEQMIWREKETQGLTIFARAGGSPPDRNLFEFVLDTGVVYRGFFPSRNDDVAGLGFVYARLSRDIREFEMLDASANGTRYSGFSDHESVLEFFYSMHLKKWWTLKPDVQWVFNPGGSTGASDAVVLGVRTEIVF